MTRSRLLATLFVSFGAVTAFPAPAAAPGVTFSDATAAAGIRFRHNSGAFGKKYLPETMGAGVLFVDLDGDGWADLLFANSKSWPGRPGAPSLPAFYRNNRDGTFTDVTRGSGLDVSMYGLGGAAADYDNDGRVDVYLTGLGGNRLFHNEGNGRFSDVTAKAGAGSSGFGTSAAFFDYDKDGQLDLFVTNYVQWSLEKDLFCTLDGTHKSYCTPESYKGQSPTLFRNRGDGTFEDVTARAGLSDPNSKALGIAVLDYDNDGWLDLFVANDTQPNKLYRNTGKGTFTDLGMSAGVAFSEAGVARAGMGTDAADYDGSGRPSIVVGNFSNEMMALYHNEGTGLFIDDAATTSIGQATLLSLSFATFFFDYDLDGRLDIFAANGHVADDIAAVQPRITYAQPPHLFRNLGAKKFEDSRRGSARRSSSPSSARGRLWRLRQRRRPRSPDHREQRAGAPAAQRRRGQSTRLRVTLVGTVSNRDAIGAKVRVLPDKGGPLTRMVKTGSSYLLAERAAADLRSRAATEITGIEMTWPSGKTERVPATAGGPVTHHPGGPGRHPGRTVEGRGPVRILVAGADRRPGDPDWGQPPSPGTGFGARDRRQPGVRTGRPGSGQAKPRTAPTTSASPFSSSLPMTRPRGRFARPCGCRRGSTSRG